MAKESSFNLKNVHFDSRLVSDLSGNEIYASQLILGKAMTKSLPSERATSYLQNLFGETEAHYIQARRHPEQSFPGQAFRHPRLSRAWVGREGGSYRLAGYLYSADNTSGGAVQRRIKMYAPDSMPKFGGKRYVHLRELAVNPDDQHRGLAHGLAYTALGHYDPDQSVTAYIWPTELPLMPDALSTAGMQLSGETEPQPIYGPEHEAVTQQRWVGSVATIRRAILSLPGFEKALSQTSQQA